jgi:hypothetical protein
VTCATPLTLHDTGIDSDKAVRQNEANLAEQFERVDADIVEVANEHVRNESSQFQNIETCDGRQSRLSGRFEDSAEDRN